MKSHSYSSVEYIQKPISILKQRKKNSTRITIVWAGTCTYVHSKMINKTSGIIKCSFRKRVFGVCALCSLQQQRGGQSIPAYAVC